MNRENFKGYRRPQPGSFGEVTERAIDQAGGVKRAAEQLGVSDKWLYAARDPEPGDRRSPRLGYDHARRLSATGVTAFAEDLALQCGGVFLPGLTRDVGGMALAAAQFGREAGEALQQVFAAVADGVMTFDEARDALPELDEALRALTALRAHVAEIVEAGPRGRAEAAPLRAVET